MNDGQLEMRKTLGWAAGITGWVLSLAAIAVAIGTHRSSQKQIAKLQSRLAPLETANAVQTVELKFAEDRLAPFARRAAVQFPDAAPDVQLAKLYEFILTRQVQRRYVNPASLFRIRSLLKDAPVLDVEVGAMSNDPEALALAAEIRRTFFESTGMHVRDIVKYSEPPNDLRGVSIYSKPQFDDSLGDIIGEVFGAIAQEKIQWLKDMTGANARDPDLKIIVGPK